MSESYEQQFPYEEINVDDRISLLQLRADEANALFGLID